jgi:cytoskeletal protein RodZ
MPAGRNPPAAAKRTPAPRHEMDELEEEGAAEQATAPAKSKLPIFVGAGAAAVVLLVLVVWGVTRSPSPAPAAQPAQPTAPVQARSEPPPPAPQPVPSPPVRAAEPAPDPSPAVAARVETPAPPPSRVETPPPPPRQTRRAQPAKVASVSSGVSKGVRFVKSELNSIPTPPAASGDGVLAVVATPWAEVEIDGRDIGETPREVQLGAGSYKVKAKHPALGTREQVVTIRPGRREVWKPTFAN